MTAGAGRALIRVNQGGLSPSGPRIYFRDIPALAGPGTGTGLRGGPGRCLLDAAALVDDAVQFADLGFQASDIEHQFGAFAMEFPGLDFPRFHALLAPGQFAGLPFIGEAAAALGGGRQERKRVVLGKSVVVWVDTGGG